MFILKSCPSGARASEPDSLVTLRRKRARDNMAGVLLRNNIANHVTAFADFCLFIALRQVDVSTLDKIL